jgi:hypothetical protein
MTDTEAKIRQLQRHFGNNIDHDVLESVLLLTEGDVNNAIQFLTAPEGQPAVILNQVRVFVLLQHTRNRCISSVR